MDELVTNNKEDKEINTSNIYYQRSISVDKIILSAFIIIVSWLIFCNFGQLKESLRINNV